MERIGIRRTLKRWFFNAKWWLLHRFHPSHRYHIINTGLPPGWYDRDVIIAVLIKKVVIDFVELEKPYEHWETQDSIYAEEWKKLKELYEYFKEVDVPLLYKDEAGYDVLTEKLVEAVKLRHLLWT